MIQLNKKTFTKGALFIVLFLIFDFIAGALIIEYFDPIGFAQEHPWVVMSSILIIPYLIKKGVNLYKNKR